jgi:hypothetical protein
MASTYINGSLLKVFLTSTGYIALCSNQLDQADEAALFGSYGKIPPRPLADLVQDMLSDLKIAHEHGDVSDLIKLERALEQSLQDVQSAMRAQ